MISLELLPASRFSEAQGFYATVGYGGFITGDCVVFAAEEDGRIVGVVRLAPEHGVIVLRGMMIAPEHQRKGLGTRFLQFMAPHMADADVYAMPHDWLEGFYGQAGFVKIDLADAPKHMQDRLNQHREKHPDLIVMIRRRRAPDRP